MSTEGFHITTKNCPMAAYKDAENDNSEAKNDFQETQSDQNDDGVAQNDISETQNYYKDTQSELIGNDNNKETQNNKLQKDAKLQQLDTK